MIAHTILFVDDQDASARFWSEALALEPQLHVPGMTEYRLGPASVLGLMPVAGIKRLLGDALPGPERAAAPSSELYVLVDEPEAAHARALGAGARELSPVRRRDWGHDAGYVLTPDGHVLAFARALAD